MLAVSIGFAAGGLLLLTIGIFIRKGLTRLIAGYDPARIRDEKGLATWVGSGVMTLGTIGILAGGLAYLLPLDYAAIPVLVYAVVGPIAAKSIIVGAQRFCK